VKKAIQDFAAMEGKNRYQTHFVKLDLKRQITVILDIFGSDHQTRNKGVGNNTKKARAYVVYQFFEDLRKNGFPIKNILNLGQKHVKAAVKIWLDADLSPSTIQLRLTILRWLCTSIGKDDMIHGPDYYGIPEDRIVRTYVATVDKSWAGNQIFTDELIQKVKDMDAWVAMNLELMQQFGLRIKESILIRPRFSDLEGSITVEEGTKGGRTRYVPIRNEAQREVLDRAILMADQNQRKSMVHPGKDLTQSIRRVYYVCEKFGITREQMNITPHGLRHEYANDRYEEIAGVPSSVRGGDPRFGSQFDDDEARHTVTRELGHARLSITSAYTGARKIGRPTNESRMKPEVTKKNPEDPEDPEDTLV
jgi:integrase